MDMRYYIGGTAMVLSAVLFASCTCHKDVGAPPSEGEQPGFHVAQPRPTPPARAAGQSVPGQMAKQDTTPAAAPSVPDDFPKDVPIYKDAAVSQVQNLANNAHNVIFSSTGSVDDAYNFYQDKLTQAGWKVEEQFSRGGQAFLKFRKGKMIANVTVAEDSKTPGKQVIAIMYEEEKPLEFEEF
jgi:hypothetical protein